MFRVAFIIFDDLFSCTQMRGKKLVIYRFYTLDEAASAIDLKSQLVSKNILSDDKNNISNITKDGNNTETDSVLKKLKFPCYKVAKKVTNAEKLKTKAHLKSKSKNSVQGQPVPSSSFKGGIKKYFTKI